MLKEQADFLARYKVKVGKLNLSFHDTTVGFPMPVVLLLEGKDGGAGDYGFLRRVDGLCFHPIWFGFDANRKLHVAAGSDTGSDHHHLAILLGDVDKGTSCKLVRLLDLPGYHIECADSTTHSNVYTVPASFFRKHVIDIDYDQNWKSVMCWEVLRCTDGGSFDALNNGAIANNSDKQSWMKDLAVEAARSIQTWSSSEMLTVSADLHHVPHHSLVPNKMKAIIHGRDLEKSHQ
ncbi:hypothetical protein N7471_003103 [Penicillium samsonianum]|uniref:uncharacterized protein n=1 Tax=Penicillium samsonianum TaxID=1882272 RepID=UPI0025472828|nr:uncharacterized protein N7471_003103 [Penicillium samsonianum]KAJ6143650.1 hypothetical protein N7471_003103 [Penicillium samsonianum]